MAAILAESAESVAWRAPDWPGLQAVWWQPRRDCGTPLLGRRAHLSYLATPCHPQVAFRHLGPFSAQQLLCALVDAAVDP